MMMVLLQYWVIITMQNQGSLGDSFFGDVVSYNATYEYEQVRVIGNGGLTHFPKPIHSSMIAYTNRRPIQVICHAWYGRVNDDTLGTRLNDVYWDVIGP